MTNSDYTVIQLVIDRSGSMSAIQDDAQGAINYYIEQQKEQPGRCSVRLTQFDSSIETVYGLTDIQEVAPYELIPRSMTALNDAIGMTIVELGKELASMPEKDRPGHVIFVIVTDGHENSSREYRNPDVIKYMISKQTEDFGWDFVYLAAGQDAVLEGGKYGINPDSALSFAGTGESYGATFDSFNVYSNAVRSGGVGSFTDEDRRRAQGS